MSRTRNILALAKDDSAEVLYINYGFPKEPGEMGSSIILTGVIHWKQRYVSISYKTVDHYEMDTDMSHSNYIDYLNDMCKQFIETHKPLTIYVDSKELKCQTKDGMTKIPKEMNG